MFLLMKQIIKSSLLLKSLSENDILIEGDSLESILDRKLRASGNALISKGNQSITG